MERPGENTFDPEQFRAALVAKTKEYATNKYITYGRDYSREINERKQARADQLYPELLDDCAEALLATDDKEGTMDVIRTILADYRYAAGSDLFPVVAKINFYHDLALRLAKKASAQ